MADLKVMTVRALRDLARKHIGPGYSKLKTKSELVAALSKVLPRSVQEALEPKEQPMEKEPVAKRTVAPEAQPERPAPEAQLAAAASEPDPEAHLVARVAGELALKEAEIPLAEEKLAPAPAPAPQPAPEFDEQLGDLPDSYGEDSVMLLPKDPRSLFLYWDFSRETIQRAFEWMPGLHTKMRVYADNELVREVDFSLDSRSWYFHGLQPDRSYRVELVSLAVDGQARRIGPASNTIRLPPDGPSSIIDDRFVCIPFDLPISRMVEAARRERAAPPFPEDARHKLYQASGGETRALGASEQRAVGGVTAAPPPAGPAGEQAPRRFVGVRSSGPWPWSGSMPWSGGMRKRGGSSDQNG
ncbi:MAG: DUF4912 domain-containing protein [Myxococcales bacterium]|jgi:hypothetical protein